MAQCIRHRPIITNRFGRTTGCCSSHSIVLIHTYVCMYLCALTAVSANVTPHLALCQLANASIGKIQERYLKRIAIDRLYLISLWFYYIWKQ